MERRVREQAEREREKERREGIKALIFLAAFAGIVVTIGIWIYQDSNSPPSRSEINATAAAYCQTAIEKKLTYRFKWTVGWTESKFPLVNRRAGNIEIGGTALEVQNQYGAWQKMAYGCVYNPSRKTVSEVSIIPFSSLTK